MINRLRCWLDDHPWPEWSAWVHGGRGAFYCERHCPRCHKHQTENG